MNNGSIGFNINYILDASVTAPFILDGDWSKQMELDSPIGYADYYFLEALYRLKILAEE